MSEKITTPRCKRPSHILAMSSRLWQTHLLALGLALCIGMLLAGCYTREVYVGSDGKYYALKKGAKVYNPSGQGGASITSGMRDSAAIQRATMRPYKVGGKWYYPTKVKIGDKFRGIASWYGPDFHSKKTSNGEIYNMYAHTAASKTLPMNTIVKVKNLDNGKSSVVRINDRGPFVTGRIIDLSNAAAHDIDMVKKGTAHVELKVIGFGGMVAKSKTSDIPKKIAKLQEFKVGSDISAVSGGSFMLQVGAFKNKDGAKSLAQKLAANSPYKVELIAAPEPGYTLYRAFLTGFKSEAEARDFMAKRGIKAIIVRK